MRLLQILIVACLYASAANANWNNHTFGHDVDYYKNEYLAANPDAILTDWQWFPGSGETDGDYTNDQFCLPFANNGNPYIIIGANDPSTCSWWADQMPQYQGAELLSFFDLNLISKPSVTLPQYVEGEIYTTEDLLGDTPDYWSGCYQVVQGGGWAGDRGGQCPNISTSGQVNYGYVEQTLLNIAAIDKALQGVGLETTGYTYAWNVKNSDANFESTNNPNSVDPFIVTIEIYDINNNVVFSKSYDYSYHIDSWVRFTGSEEFANPFDLDTLAELQLSITGYDIGGWAGWYGPEFSQPDVRLNYRVKEDNTLVEDILFEQMCLTDPMYDINCPGYNDALLAQMNDFVVQADFGIPSEIDDGMVDVFGVDDFTGVPDVLEMDILEDPIMTAEDILTPGETIIEAAPLESVVESATEVTAETTESSPEPSAEGTQRSGGGLSANQRFALDQAQQASASSEQTASDQSQASGEAADQANGDASGFGSDGQSLSADGSSVGGSTFSSSFDMETTADLFDNIVADITSTLLTTVSAPAVETPVEREMSSEERNQQEDDLVAEALEGSEDEDAQSALLGYNPNFRAYQQPQMPGGDIYNDQGVYENQKTYDNPNARLFNGASDALHREMVRSQYEK